MPIAVEVLACLVRCPLEDEPGLLHRAANKWGYQFPQIQHRRIARQPDDAGIGKRTVLPIVHKQLEADVGRLVLGEIPIGIPDFKEDIAVGIVERKTPLQQRLILWILRIR